MKGLRIYRLNNAIRDVRMQGAIADLHGFHFGGPYRVSDQIPVAQPIGVISYDVHRMGIGAANINLPGDSVFIAYFAYANNGDHTASIGITPFLKVSGAPVEHPELSPVSTEITFDPQSGALIDDAYAGTEVLICHKNGDFSGAVATVESNSATTVHIQGLGHGLADGDYLLLAPPGKDRYGYIGTGRLDYGTNVFVAEEHDTHKLGDLRNYAASGSMVGSSHGTVITQQSGSYVEVDFRGKVPPLATGVRGAIHASLKGAGNGSCYAFISHDSSNHVVEKVGLDNTTTFNDGVTGTFSTCPFGARQSLWVLGSNSDVEFQIEVTGWSE